MLKKAAITSIIVSTIKLNSNKIANNDSKEKSLYSWGLNLKGQLGLGNNKNINIPTEVERFKGKNIIQIECSANNTALLDSEGHIYIWGSSQNGILGNSEHDEFNNQLTPILLRTNNNLKFQSFSLADNHIAAITETGDLYTWGNNDNNQLLLTNNISGNNKDELNLRTPLTYNSRNSHYISEPKLCENYKNIKSVYCKSDFTIIIDSEDRVFSTKKITTDSDNNNNDIFEIKELYKKGVNKFAYSQDSIYFISEDQTLYKLELFGYDNRVKPFLNNIKNIKCGNMFCLALDNYNDLSGWGKNSKGQFGNGTKIDSKRPIEIEFSKEIYDIAVGSYHSMIIDKDKNLWASGEGKLGQLGNGGILSKGDVGSRDYFSQITSMNNCDMIACGNEHCVTVGIKNK